MTRSPQSLSDWQTNARKGIKVQYDEALARMYDLDRTLRKLNTKLTYFQAGVDSADRPILFFCEPEKPKKRVSLKAKRDFFDNEVRPASRDFRAAMGRVRDLHFQCRNSAIEVPKSTFDFLVSWGVVRQGNSKKNN